MGKRREREGPPLVRKFLDPPLCRTRFVIVSFVACRTQNAVGFLFISEFRSRFAIRWLRFIVCHQNDVCCCRLGFKVFFIVLYS